MLQLKKFLFCIKLETGATIIGYLSIIVSLLLGIVFLLASAFYFQDVMDFIKERIRRPNENVPQLRKLFYESVNDKLIFFSLEIFVIFVMVISIILVNVYVSIRLLKGIQEV